ncbi:hypothetical protein BZA77DRAFT_347519 [Pyronema omphalodes]|nr:hypothetical protein BZA77DRAFT_347519 [Pyronema omphalodes]
MKCQAISMRGRSREFKLYRVSLHDSMDPFSVSTGIAGFLSLTIQIGVAIGKYVSDVKSAEKEAQDLYTEIQSLQGVLEQLVGFLRGEETKKISFDDNAVFFSVIGSCQSIIEDLYKKLVKVGISKHSSKFDHLMQRGKWPFQKEECQQLVNTLHRYARIFEFSLHVSNCNLLAKTSSDMDMVLRMSEQNLGVLSAIKEVSQSNTKMQHSTLITLQGIRRHLTESEVSELLEWISSIDPQIRHHDIRRSRAEGTGDWFLRTEQFMKWKDYSQGSEESFENSILGIYGIPGAGKSVIFSLIVDHIQDAFEFEDDFCLTWLYCDYDNDSHQTLENMIGALLRQAVFKLYYRSKGLPRDVIHKLLKRKREKKPLETTEATEFLSQILRLSAKSYICIDALDECRDDRRRFLLQSLKALSNALKLNQYSVRILVTARHHVNEYINLDFVKDLACIIELEANQEDIAKYVRQELENDVSGVAMTEEFKETVIAKILSSSNGMFLLPALQIQSVLECATPRDRQEALNTMPEGLEDAFEVTLKRINRQKSKSKHAMKIVQWIFLAVRPLSIDELRHALATHPNDTEYDDQRALTTSQIIDFCLGLVILDKETSTVRLVHKSLQDYLCSEYDDGNLFQNGHEELAVSCLTYMNFNYSSTDGFWDESALSIVDSSTEPGPGNTADRLFNVGRATLEKYAFLDYAICNWSHHVIAAPNDKVEELGIKFLSSNGGLQCISGNLRTWPILIAEDQLCTPVWPVKRLSYLDEGEMKGALVNSSNVSISGLHIASIYGVQNIVQTLIDSGPSDINAQFKPGASPLLLATIGNQNSVINLLLETPNIEINLEDEHNAKLLFVAAYNGSLDAVPCQFES